SASARAAVKAECAPGASCRNLASKPSYQACRIARSLERCLRWECSPAHGPLRQGRAREERVEKKSLEPLRLLTTGLRLRSYSPRRVKAPSPLPRQLRLRLERFES